MKKFTPFLIAVIMLGFTNYIIAQTRNPNQYKDQDKEKLEKLAEKFHQKFLQQRAEVERVAQEKGWAIREETEDGVREIQYISPNGMPQYYTTHNLNAARTINTDDLWVGGSSGLNLTGSGFTAGEWDGGGVRTTHQEFGGRVTQQDSPGATSYHSTHVAGTIVAQGQVNAAHGMAYEAELDAYDWTDDVTEMTNAASGGLTLSNHSYGYTRGWYNSGGTWYWYGNPSISSTEDYLFGFYDSYSQGWDQIAYNAPHYLVCKSSGNDRNDDHSGGHYYWNGTSWVYSTASRDPDGGADGYDCIDQLGVSKNILTVGAVEDITGGWTQPSDVVMSSFSSWGPTDDGRIKPDLVANGVYVYSTDDDADDDYRYIDGTSMSTPSVTGTLALLQDYYESLRGGYMSAAALKGLAINTANEAGPADGPDYMFGWGLMNATGAAGLITDDDTEGGLIVEGILENGQTIDYTYYSDGTTDINVTLCWTDPAGTPPAASLNPSTLMLVNDLDLRLIDGAKTTYFPWMLHPSTPSGNAYKGDNYRDNVETVNHQSPSAGYYTIRINHSGTLSGSEQAYAMIVTGLSTPPTETYCDARSNNEVEYIQNVTMGDIDNTSDLAPGGYANYTGIVTEVSKGSNYTITATLGNPYSGDDVYAWIDWNQDGDFSDTGEDYILGTVSAPYSTTISVPSSATSGYTTMRVRLVYSYGQNPCGNSSYGETEDYAIKVTGTPGLWAGTISTNWNTAGNWDDGNVPTSTVSVTIPSGTPFAPWIYTTDAECLDITIESGTLLQIWDENLTVDDDMTIHGELQMTQNSAKLYVNNDIFWESGSTANIVGSSVEMWIKGTWEFKAGSNVHIDNGYVEFDGSSNEFIRSKSVDSYFNHVRSDKDAGYYIGHSGQSTEALIINGNLFNYVDSKIVSFDNNDIILRGSFNNFSGATIQLGNGTFVFDGTTHTVSLNAGDYFNNLTISSSGNTSMSTDFVVNGNMLIESGALVTNNHDIEVGGNWTNNVGSAGFTEGTGRVIFDGGNYHQYCSDETFNELEVNKASGGAFCMDGTDVVCAAYDWTDGAVDVLSGSFTANDLIDNGIFGAFYTNPGGTINLHKPTGYADFNGDLIFSGGGEIHVYGSGTSYIPYANDASITMSGGVLDFHNTSIRIHNNHVLTTNITGGTIRTAGYYSSYRTDFNPTAGLFEFYGTIDRTIYQVVGTSLYNVDINKVADDKIIPSGFGIVEDIRDGKSPYEGGKANNISLSTDFVITNDLEITAGSLTLNGNELTVAHGCDVYGTLNMTNVADVLNVGTYSYDNLSFNSGSTGNLSAGNVNIYSWIGLNSGCFFTATTGNTINVVGGNTSSGVHNDDPASVYGNIVINKTSNRAYIATDSDEDIVVNGDFIINAGNEFEMNDKTMIVHGTFTDNSSSEIYVYNASKSNNGLASTKQNGEGIPLKSGAKGGYLEIDNDFTLNGLLDVADGDVLLHGVFGIATTGTLNIDGGTFIIDVPNHAKGWEYLSGTFNMTDGLFEITYNSPRFGSSATSNISGGIIRCGYGFHSSTTAGVFTPTGGVVEFIGNSANGNAYCYSGNSFYDLRINCLTGNTVHYYVSGTTVANDMIIDNGVLECGYGASYDLYVGGNWSNNVGSGGFIPNTGTVYFNGPYTADITTTETFYNLTLDKTYSGYTGLEMFYDINVTNDLHIVDGTLEMKDPSDLIVGNDVTIELDAGLNANDPYSKNIYVGGNWTNYNTAYDNNYGFSPNNSTVIFNGGSNQILTTAAPQEDFNNLTIYKGGGEFKSNDNTQAYGNILIYMGIWKDNITALTHTVWGDFTVESGGAMYTSSMHNTIIFKGTSDATLKYLGASGYFHNITVDKTSTKYEAVLDPDAEKVSLSDNTDGGKAQSVMVLSYFSCQQDGSLIVEEGTLNLNGNNFGGTGDVIVNNGGILIVDDNANLKIGGGSDLTINNGGTLQAIGSAGNEATIQTLNTGYYNFEIENGGTISAEYAIFEDMSYWGIYLKSGSLVDPVYSFNNCTFRYQDPISNSSLLTISNDQVFSVSNAAFTVNTGPNTYNVWKSVNAGDVTFVDATGDFAGPEYEYDLNNRVHWTDIDVELDLEVMLEGPFNGTGMNTDLNALGLIPLSQPFNSIPTADWYYTGTESVASVPANVVDWVLVQIRDADDAASAGTGTLVAEQAAFLLNNGSIVDLDGLSNLIFPGLTYSSGLFPVVWQRNHLGIISSDKMTRSGGIYTYDFTQAGAAYSNTNPGEKLLGGSIWGMFSGDASGGGVINDFDMTFWSDDAGSQGYLQGDFDLDSQADNKDKNDYWFGNLGNESQIPGSKNNDN